MREEKEKGNTIIIKHGFGEMKWANGDYYQGQWYDNMMHGEGKLVHCNKDIYQGEFY